MIWSQGQGWIGLDIGSSTLKVVQVERRGQEYRLAAALILRREKPWQTTENAELPVHRSHQEMRAAIHGGRRFRGRVGAAVLSMGACDVNEWTVPEDRRGNADSLVMEQMDELYAAAAQQREIGYWATRGTRSGPGVIAVSLARGWSRQIVRDMSAAGLEARVLDALPLALTRAVVLTDPSRAEIPTIAIDWGHQRTTLCAISHGNAEFVRPLRNTAFGAVVDRLCVSLAIKPDEAHKLLKEPGLPSPDTNHADGESRELTQAIADILAPELDHFVEEVQKTITFLRQQRKFQPQRVILSGGGATIANVVPHLQSKLGVAVHRWRMKTDRDFGGRWPAPLELLAPAAAMSMLAWQA